MLRIGRQHLVSRGYLADFLMFPMKPGPEIDPSPWMMKSAFFPLGAQSSRSLPPFVF
jgi:hypothetical protein